MDIFQSSGVATGGREVMSPWLWKMKNSEIYDKVYTVPEGDKSPQQVTGFSLSGRQFF